MAFNLFANIDEFCSNDNNSFSELEANNLETVHLSDVVETKPLAKSRKRKQRAKSNKKSEAVFDDSDTEYAVTVTETVVSPGLGQKTAFKKLTQLKKNLETIAVAETSKRTTRAAINAGLREDYQRMRSKRSRLAATVQSQYVEEISSATPLRLADANESFDDEEVSLSIKIKWEGTSKIEKIPFSLYKTFNELVTELSTREKIDARSFLLMFGNNVIKRDDSPHSIGYTLGKFISVRVVDNPSSYIPESTSSQGNTINTIEVKIQCPQWKKPITCNIKKTDQFKVLAGMCSEKLKCGQEKLRLKFDGDIIDISSTPDDLDFEGGEIVDLLISD